MTWSWRYNLKLKLEWGGTSRAKWNNLSQVSTLNINKIKRIKNSEVLILTSPQLNFKLIGQILQLSNFEIDQKEQFPQLQFREPY